MNKERDPALLALFAFLLVVVLITIIALVGEILTFKSNEKLHLTCEASFGAQRDNVVWMVCEET